MCRNTPGKYYYGEGITGECCFCGGKTEVNLNLHELIKEAIPVMWDIKPKMPTLRYRLSYGSKARVETLLSHYISNDDFIKAALELEIPHTVGNPNYLFAIKPKFPMEWLQLSGRLTVRPFGARKTEWAAYQAAHQWWDQQQSDYEEMIDYQQEFLADFNSTNPEDPVDDPILKLKTREEKVRYALRRV
jgi:hypothetical protein